jgi:hypothetical protein
MPLTDDWLREHHRKRCGGAWEATDGEGLGVRVSAKGKISFQMRFRWLNKPERKTLGVYPYMSLTEARLKHRHMVTELNAGRDPRTVDVPPRSRRGRADTATRKLLAAVEEADLPAREREWLRVCLSVVSLIPHSIASDHKED